MKVFKDKNGVKINPGDVLRHVFFVRHRERPGHKRVAVEGMTGREVIVLDEGQLKDGTEVHWAEYHVRWCGACLIAERVSYSDFQALMQSECFNEKGERVSVGAAFYYMNSAFNSTVYEVRNGLQT